MTPEIKTERFSVTLYGASKRHEESTCYGDDIRQLLDRVWPVLRQNGIPNRGINHVVYGPDSFIFAGVEAEVTDAAAIGLEKHVVELTKYAYWKHIGSYRLLGGVVSEMREALKQSGTRLLHPLVEVYGHWNDDESKLETEIIQNVE